MIIFLYVDDCGITSPTMSEIDAFLARMRIKGFELTKDEGFSEYLGIQFEQNTTSKSIAMTQPGLINKILKATDLTTCKPNRTPTHQCGLATDPDGLPMEEHWNYTSVVGMLLYLSTNTRPDITFAVSQVARFCSNPKKSHSQAIKMIVRYLSGTVNNGITFSPTENFKLDMYVDADFVGLHGREPQDNPISARSRTGYIIFFCGCPLMWKSQLQTETALSTFGAEYVALSSGLRTLIPLQRVLQDMVNMLEHHSPTPTVHSEVFEDNSSAYLLANNQRLSNRSLHLNVKYHHFWEQVRNKTIKTSQISTTEQRANFLTKGLSPQVFETIRRYNQGW
ncbi:hypothetical protein ACA910_002899 [Epithemia clementina (nom. ined.)]